MCDFTDQDHHLIDEKNREINDNNDKDNGNMVIPDADIINLFLTPFLLMLLLICLMVSDTPL